MIHHSAQPHPQKRQSGQLLLLVLVFGAVFLVILGAFIGNIVSQSQAVQVRIAQQQATDIAEAGLNQYKWKLNRFPGDYTGQGAAVVYEKPEAGVVGEYELAVASTSYCGVAENVRVEATAHTYDNPDIQAVVSATYKRPTVAEYSFITNGAMWYGPSRVITGPVHGNQGIRMDGAHNSSVASGQETFICDSSFGCSGTQTQPGVFAGSGSNATPELFMYPAAPFDFTGLTVDLVQLRQLSQTQGIYFGPTAGGRYGYHVMFNGDGTFDVREVTRTSNYWSYSSTEGWHRGERNNIRSSTLVANDVLIPSGCPVLFFADKVWIEGDVDQKVTLAAALNSGNYQNNIVIHGSGVDYVPNTDAGLLAIAEDDVDIGLQVENNLVANGIYIAQNGRFGRNHYCDRPCGSGWYDRGLDSSLDDFVSRSSLTRLGSVISNLRGGTEWTNGGTHISGFYSRITSFDRDQVDNPPPLTPATSDVYELQDWRQEG